MNSVTILLIGSFTMITVALLIMHNKYTALKRYCNTLTLMVATQTKIIETYQNELKKYRYENKGGTLNDVEGAITGTEGEVCKDRR